MLNISLQFLFRRIATIYLSCRHTNLKQRRINVYATSWRRINVNTTLFWRHVPAGSMYNFFIDVDYILLVSACLSAYTHFLPLPV